jgi:hypothetical protein
LTGQPALQNYPAKSLSYDLINRQYRETAPGIDWCSAPRLA